MKSLFALIAGAMATLFAPPPNVLEEIRASRSLHVMTRESPTTYFHDGSGPEGFEYRLAQAFAAHLGVDLEMSVAETPADIFRAVAKGRAHVGAAGLAEREAYPPAVRFGPGYHEVSEQLVYRRGAERPRAADDLYGGRLAVAAGSHHVLSLRALRREFPDLRWQEDNSAGTGTLLERVVAGELDYTVANSNEVATARRHLPDLQVGFEIGGRRDLAWMFRRNGDDSLYFAALGFFAELRRSGALEELVQQHYGHIGRFDYVGAKRLLAHVEKRLPKFSRLFRDSAERHGLDWRLLAAIGYQESHWKVNARSPTGVGGLMMLTRATAGELGVEDRFDPAQSIEGGARYFRRIKRRLPERIQDPDRTWLALAAYNVGLGHLEDARVITQKHGEDPDRWSSVKKYLPLLREKKWYEQTKHGFARGDEPVRYVDNIRHYYDTLVGLDLPVPAAAAEGESS